MMMIMVVVGRHGGVVWIKNEVLNFFSLKYIEKIIPKIYRMVKYILTFILIVKTLSFVLTTIYIFQINTSITKL